MRLFNFNSKPKGEVIETPPPETARWKPSDELLEVLRRIEEFVRILPEMSGYRYTISILFQRERLFGQLIFRMLWRWESFSARDSMTGKR